MQYHNIFILFTSTWAEKELSADKRDIITMNQWSISLKILWVGQTVCFAKKLRYRRLINCTISFNTCRFQGNILKMTGAQFCMQIRLEFTLNIIIRKIYMIKDLNMQTLFFVLMKFREALMLKCGHSFEEHLTSCWS